MLRYSARIHYKQLQLPLQVLRQTHYISNRILSVIELAPTTQEGQKITLVKEAQYREQITIYCH
jgi:hypothetical protein